MLFLCHSERGLWKGGVSPFHLERKVSLPNWKRMVSVSLREGSLEGRGLSISLAEEGLFT